ncbi:MAG TPA: carbon-nitrogen hydrolase family protein [Desulfatiglandales bacterium]|nr:carbon-nitrogen hydrolase family protein [Desulfatiglandales bacterium]
MTYQETVSVACVNFHTEWGDKAANLSKMKAFTVEAARQGNNMIIFPEMALSGYECSEDIEAGTKSCRMHRELAEVIPGPSTEEMRELGRELGVYIIFGMPEQDKINPDTRYISSAIIGPEGILGSYRKLHLAPPPRFKESICFSPGDEVPVWKTRYGVIGVLICYDFYFFPELARIMTLKGATLLINTTASVAGPGKPYFIVQQTGSRATENLVYAASANLVGKERTKAYYGHSVIAGPLTPRPAFVFAEGGETEEIVSATLSFPRLHSYAELLDWKKSRRSHLINSELSSCERT